MSKDGLDCKLGMFYLLKNDGDFNACEDQLLRLQITETKLDGRSGCYTIKLRRPGLLIGVKGSNCIKLEQYLGVKLLIEEEKKENPYTSIIPRRV